MIDLRSDTVTRPTPAMLAHMFAASVGDDMYGEDPSVNALQSQIAQLFGMEAALFCPSGTMANQLAIKVHTQPGDEVLCAEHAHVYAFEGGGIAFNSGASVRLLAGDRGRFTAGTVRDSLNPPADVHYPRTRLVVIENTSMRGGGCCWDLREIARIREVCREHGLALHLDGARLFNALVARNESPALYGELFDSISICLSKGLGAPVGSLLIGTRAGIALARRYRKILGGAMRQSGYLAAAGSYALEHHVARLREDHARAAVVALELATHVAVQSVLTPETNLVFFDAADAKTADRLMAHLAARTILVSRAGQHTIRLAFHLDIDDAQVDATLAALRSFR